MGNCSSCFKVLPPSETNITDTTLEKDKEEIMESCDSVETLPSTVANGNKAPPAPVVGSDNCGSLKRAFYPRIARPVEQGNKGPHALLLREPSESKMSALFEAYRDASEDAILADGVERLCSDLSLPPDEFRVLVLAWKLNAERMCRFSRSEFIGGCRAMRVDSVRAMQARLPELAAELAKDPELFKDLYRFTFRFGLDSAGGQRVLPADMAACLWRVVFSPRPPPLLPRWLAFLEERGGGVPRDTWNMFLNLCEAVGSDLGGYDDSEAWPSLFDDFVEHENDRTNQNVSKEDARAEYCESLCRNIHLYLVNSVYSNYSETSIHRLSGD